jgi:hypothetical protein
MATDRAGIRFKRQADSIKMVLARRGVGLVYHWTLAAQIPSILEYGLLCPRILQEWGIAHEAHGYGAAGKDVQFAGYVCLSFLPHWGMMSRASGPVAIIEMTSAVLMVDGTFYCPGNTARNDYDFDEVSTWTGEEHLEALFEDPTSYRVKDIQAEVWVPERIPVSAFRRVLFRSAEELDATREAARPIEPSLPKTLVFQVEARRFPPTIERGDDEIDIEDIPW